MGKDQLLASSSWYLPILPEPAPGYHLQVPYLRLKITVGDKVPQVIEKALYIFMDLAKELGAQGSKNLALQTLLANVHHVWKYIWPWYWTTKIYWADEIAHVDKVGNNQKG